MRSIHLPWTGKKSATAEFFLSFAPASSAGHAIKAEHVKFLSGEDSLRSYTSKLQAAEFNISFPDETPIKLVRRGILSCGETSHECQFVLILPEDVRTVD